MKKLLLLSILFICIQLNTKAQGTVLAPGDVAIIQLQADNPDEFAFITFVDLVAGTTIYFTDCGTAAGGTFNNPCGEGAQKFVAAGPVEAGSIIQFPSAQITTHTDSRITGTMSFATSGDQLIAFQDSDGAGGSDPAQNPSFIYALNQASTLFTGDPADSNQTSLPSGLSVPTSALGVGSGTGTQDEWDNVVFNVNLGPFGTVADAQAAIQNPANWIGENDFTANPYATTSAAIPGTLVNNLPVELISFQGKAQSSANELTWSTASETVFSHYEIERSLDGRDFSQIGEVIGNGETASLSEYGFLDRDLASSSHYYRLKMVDLDQTFEYSPIILVKSNSKFNASVFPNPSSNHINIELSNANTAFIQYAITTMDGKLLQEGSLNIEDSKIDVSQLPSGFYLIQINDAGISESLKFMKE